MLIILSIIFLGVSCAIYKNRELIKNSYQLYKLYKNTIDPNNLGHFYTLKSIMNLFFIKKEHFEKFNKKHLKIPYKYKDKNYFYLLKIPKGMIPLCSIQDEKGNDIKDSLLPYLGPNLDCHGISIFPKDFGYEKIKIKTIYDRIVIFNENDKIDITEQEST